MRILLAALGLVLPTACFNVANLLLARSVTRAREVSIRMAIGATRWRIVRQMLVESVSLSLVSAMVGLLIALWSVEYLKSLVPPQLGLSPDDIRIVATDMVRVAPAAARIYRCCGDGACGDAAGGCGSAGAQLLKPAPFKPRLSAAQAPDYGRYDFDAPGTERVRKRSPSNKS
jgi:hypothetical protein